MIYSIHSLVTKGLVGMMVLGLVGHAYALDCDNAMNQRDLNQCAYLDFQREDKVLNQLYNKHREGLDAKRKNQLKVAQQAWLKFRDLSCGYEADFYEGGSIAPMVYSGCLTAETKNRIIDLKNYLDYPQ